MSALYATGRLLWRPATILALFPLGLATGLAFVELPSLGAGVQAADGAARLTLWRFATVAPAMLGMLFALLMRELQHTRFAWSLPGLSHKLRTGKLVFIALAAVVATTVSIPFADPALSVAVLGWSALCISLGGVAFDPVLSKAETRAVLVLLAALAFRPQFVLLPMEWAPLVTGTVALIGAVVLVRRELSVSLSRRRALTYLSPNWTDAPAAMRQYWRRENPRDVEWRTNLAEGGLADWIRAAHLETFGGAKGSLVLLFAWQVLVSTVVAFVVGGTAMVALFPWIAVSNGGLQLHARFLYPLSRTARAKLFFASSIVESTGAVLAGIAGIAILFVLNQQTGRPSFDEPREIAAFAIMYAAWSPFLHWAKIYGPLTNTGMSGKHGIRAFIMMMLFVVLSAISAITFDNLAVSAPVLTYAGAAILVLATHSVYWIALRRHYRTRDLIVSRA